MLCLLIAIPLSVQHDGVVRTGAAGVLAANRGELQREPPRPVHTGRLAVSEDSADGDAMFFVDEEGNDPFDVVDRDRSAQLDRKEFKKALVSLGYSFSAMDRASIYSDYDVDGSGTIDHEEFHSMLADMYSDGALNVEP